MAGTKRGIEEIATVNGDEEVNVSYFGMKSEWGPKMGVQLWFHKCDEYRKLTAEEKKELK